MADISLSNKTILVTGGAGFIGSHLVDALLREGCKVVVLDDLSNGCRENLQDHTGNAEFQFIQGSIIEDADIKRAMENVDIVFHLACLGVRHSIKHPLENHRVNAEGTLRLLEQVLKQKVEKFIYCSSSEIYGTAQTVPMTEEHPVHPHTVYGSSKFAGECYTRAYKEVHNLPIVVIRPFNTFGPRSHQEGDCGEVIPKFISRALNDRELLIFGDGTQTRDFTYVEDTAQGLLFSAKSELVVGKTLNIGSNFEISINKLADKVLDLVEGASSQKKFLDSRPGDVLRLFSDVSKFIDLTQWSSNIGFEEGLRRTLQWFESRPEGITSLLEEEVDKNWQ